MKYLILIMLVTTVCLGGCRAEQSAPVPAGGAKATTTIPAAPAGSRLPPPVEYDER